MKMSFWKVLGFFGIISTWAQESLMPDDDGVVRLTAAELTDLAVKMCAQFGWTAEIEL